MKIDPLNRTSTLIACVSFACCFASSLAAQDLIAKPEHTVRLHLLTQRLTGSIVSIERDTVFLRRTMDGPPSAVPISGIQRIEVRFPGANRQGRTIGGLLIGGAVGASAGIYLSTHVACADCVITIQDQILGTLLFTGVFSALGGIVGFASTPPRWVPATIHR